MSPDIGYLIDHSLDVTAPSHIEVEWDPERKVLYVHIGGVTVLRCCRVENFQLKGGKLNATRNPS